MATYTVTLAQSARKELERLDEPLRTRIFRRIERFATEPRPAGCKKLQGSKDLWRIRVGDYRVLYSVDDRKCHVDVSAIRHRSDVYR